MTIPPKETAAQEARLERGVRVGKALSHRIRIEVLDYLVERDDAISPPQMSAAGVAPGASNPHLNYHVGELARLGCLEDVRQRPRRGAQEHFFIIRPFGREVIATLR